MRARALVRTVIGIVLLAVGLSHDLLGQEVALAGRRPRFLYAPVAGATPVEIDASRNAALRRVVALQVEQPTVARLLAAIEQQTGLTFAYGRSLATDRPIALRAETITVGAALSAILFDTGLDVVLSPRGHVALVGVKAGTGRGQTGAVTGRLTDSKTGDGLGGVDVSLEGTRWRTTTAADGRYQLADVAPGSYTMLVRRIGYGPERRAVIVSAGQEAAVNVALQLAAARIGDLVVTAQKREERLQNVPIPVTAVRADRLVDNNQLRFQDYYTSIPGVSLQADGGRGSPGNIVIRNLASGGGNPTVGLVVDDVPYGSSSSNGGAGHSGVPDIDPSELARVEVLRGPQGTLYGASSIGGLLKYVTVDPSTDRVSGSMQMGGSSVYNGAEPGYNVRGAVNVPLGKTLAVRASGFTRRDPGYIDDLGRGRTGVNRVDVHGGRVSGLWRPSQDFSITLSALLQDRHVHGVPRIEPGFGDLQQRALPGTGEYNGKSEVYTATLNGKLGSVDLTSVSGYNVNNWSTRWDLTPVIGAFASAFFADPVGALTPDYNNTKKFTQEIRLSGAIGQKFEWRFGAFYTDERSRFVQNILAADLATGAPVSSLLHTTFPTGFAEYAAFADVTFHVTDRFDLQVGGRQSHNRQTFTATLTGPWVPAFYGGLPSPLVEPEVVTKDNSFTYLLTPRFTVSPELMVYGRLASGYRAGGPNFVSTARGLPPAFGPDKTRNYEIGVKGDVLGHALSFDASLYYIDWSDIQLTLFDASRGASYFINGSQAKSQGVELSVESRPLTGLTIAAWAAWTDAELTADLPPGAPPGRAGDRLPGTDRFSGNVSLDQEFPLASNVTGFVGGSVSHRGDRIGDYVPSPLVPRASLPGYDQADIRAGVRYSTWAVNFFVNNVADTRGVLTSWAFYPPNTAFNYIQPRTAGLTVAKTF